MLGLRFCYCYSYSRKIVIETPLREQLLLLDERCSWSHLWTDSGRNKICDDNDYSMLKFVTLISMTMITTLIMIMIM